MTRGSCEPVTATEDLIGNLAVPYGVAHDNHLAFVDLPTSDDPCVLSGSFSTPTADLDLQFVALVSKLEEAGRSFEQPASKVGQQPEGVDIDTEFVDHASEQIDVRWRAELRLVADQVFETTLLGAAGDRECEEVQLGSDADGWSGDTEA